MNMNVAKNGCRYSKYSLDPPINKTIRDIIVMKNNLNKICPIIYSFIQMYE